MDVENSLEQKVVTYLEQLGLHEEQAQIYLYLLKTGPSTVLAISRGLKTGRTKLYPLLEDIAKKQLITIHERHYGTSYEAQPPSTVEFLVSEKERAADALRKDMPATIDILSKLHGQSPATTKIIEYKGIDGLKQMNYNLSRAEKQFKVFELDGLDTHFNPYFATKMRELYNSKGLISYDITNIPDRHERTDAQSPLSKVAYISPDVFVIEFETFIYNNCVGLISYDENDIFGVEIYNEKLARQQNQLFDLLWKQAKRFN